MSINSFEKEAIFEFRETYDWLEGKGLYPDQELPEFQSAINELHEHLKILAKKVLRLWAIGLGMQDDADFFIKKHHHWIDPLKFTGLTNMRLAHYPKIPEDLAIPKGSVRIAEHSDIASLSFVIQDETGGLEVRTRHWELRMSRLIIRQIKKKFRPIFLKLKNSEGIWVQVPPIPGAIVCNTGDLMEFWTSGLFRATV
jgi:isopenicillin N synthase-like dioxygenase